ncbi:MAG: hypothetical protein JXA90_12360, partial [Planctomycetes bacterium]|nr:hypothetical protein [Planctomycetota bacterium]
VPAAEALPLEPALLDLYRSLASGNPEPVAFRVDGTRIVRGALWPAPSAEPRRRLVVATTRDPRALIDAASAASPFASRSAGSEVLLVDLRGEQGRRHLHLLATDSLLAGEALLPRRARDLAAVARAPASGRRGGGDGDIALAAADPHAALAVLIAQAFDAPASGIILAGLSEQPLAPLDGDLDPDAAVWRLLAAADVPALAARAGVPIARLPAGAGIAAIVEAFEASGRR